MLYLPWSWLSVQYPWMSVPEYSLIDGVAGNLKWTRSWYSRSPAFWVVWGIDLYDMKAKYWTVFGNITYTSQVTETVAMATEFSQSQPWSNQVEIISWGTDSCNMKDKCSTVFEISCAQKYTDGRSVGRTELSLMSPRLPPCRRGRGTKINWKRFRDTEKKGPIWTN